jgi:hypothetical protein
VAIVPVQPIFCQRRIPQRSLMAPVGRSVVERRRRERSILAWCLT